MHNSFNIQDVPMNKCNNRNITCVNTKKISFRTIKHAPYIHDKYGNVKYGISTRYYRYALEPTNEHKTNFNESTVNNSNNTKITSILKNSVWNLNCKKLTYINEQILKKQMIKKHNQLLQKVLIELKKHRNKILALRLKKLMRPSRKQIQQHVVCIPIWKLHCG